MTNSADERQFREDLPKALVLLRESRGLSQKELAARLGVHASVLSRHETGMRTPATVKLAMLLKTLLAGWGELGLALAAVRRAHAKGEEPSAETLRRAIHPDVEKISGLVPPEADAQALYHDHLRGKHE